MLLEQEKSGCEFMAANFDGFLGVRDEKRENK